MPFDERLDGVLEDPLALAEFQRLTPELTDFADSHALLVERYKRGFAMWTFLFRHPKGGAASLQLSISVSKETREPLACIFPHWWQDDEAESRRKLGELAVLRDVAPDASILRSALERALSDVLHATPAVLTRQSTIAARPAGAEGNPQYSTLDEANLPLPR
ncbi:MAG: hypothetical protein ABI821_00150 [Pseudomonadota bacterium]